MLTKRIVLSVALLFTLSSAAYAIRIGGAAQPAAATAVEPHPEINRAIAALEKARFHLQHARHDFGGHRVAALMAIDRALEQLHLAVEFDR